jgi:serine/threonine protein kinase
MTAATPSTASKGDAFLSVLRKSQLIDESKLHEAIAALHDPATSEPKDVAQAFINMGLLTRFQVRLLLQGKWRGFFIAGKYRLLDMIGEGGMGKVYLCEHLRMQRLVALKVLPARTAEDKAARERFDREARAIASLNHPNIVQAYDIDSHDGMHYIVMEFVDGVSLQALVALRGPLTMARSINYLAQAAAGLQHGHEMGLVHRDVKPANLLLGRDGIVKILDYGLARFFDSRSDDLTKRQEGNSIIGTADYLAPEQAIDCSDVDVRADLYALGGTAYYLLTGQPPFGKDIPTHTKLLAHQSKYPQPLRELRPDLDPEFCEVIRKLLMKKLEDRYQGPREILAALSPWLNQPVAPPTDDEIPLRDALATTKAIIGNTTAKLGTSSDSSTQPHGKSVTIVVDRQAPIAAALAGKKPLPSWIWAAIGGIVVGIVFLLWPPPSSTRPGTIPSGDQSPLNSNNEVAPVLVGKGSTLSLSGTIPGRLEVETDATLVLGGPLTLEQGLACASGSLIRLEPNSHLVVKHGTVKIDGARLTFDLPSSESKVAGILRNETGQPVHGTFSGAVQGQKVTSADGRWQGLISYQGDLTTGSASGGHDIVVYQAEKK